MQIARLVKLELAFILTVVISLLDAKAQSEAEQVVVRAQVVGELETELPHDMRVPGESATALIDRAANAIVNEAGASSFEDVYSVRGLANTPNFSKQALTIYVDDVPSSSTFTNFSEVGAVNRAVLFRGPQGDYFGKNSEAGLLELTTKPADVSTLELEGAAGNYDMWSGHAFVSGPILPNIAFVKLEGDYFSRDGFLENTFRDTRPDFQQHAFERITLRVIPSPDWDITLSAEFHQTNDGVQRFVPLFAPDPFRVAFDFDGRTDISGNVESLRISHAMDAAQLTLITSWRDWSLDPYEADFDYSPVPFVRGRFVLGQNQIAQEVRLDSRDQESGWRWRIGVFADRISSDGTEEFLFQQFTKLISFNDHNDEAAIFCRSTWDLGNGFELTAGARLEYSDESITRSRRVSFESATTNFDAARSEWNAQPRLALTYKWSREISLFIDSTYGYKSGGFSFLETDPRLAQFDTERVWLNEIGARAATSDQRFELRTLAFVNRIEDYQVERPAIPPDITIFNAPLVVSWGAEFEAVARPIDNLELRGSVGYTKSEFREFHDPFTAVNYRGNATPFTPEFTVNASARYTWRGIFLQGEVLAAGETFYDEANTEDLREAPHAQLNARVGYETRHFVLTIFCENLTEERYFTQKIASANVGTPVPPRTFGGSASLKF